jgi:galactose mutarotase-like enzyme
MLTITNEKLEISFISMGAELQSIYHKENKIEYLWDGNPAFWAKRSPVLFPVVGGLKDGTYQFDNKNYHFNRHGFGRESNFSIESHTENSIVFTLETSEETLALYPFYFKFSVIYTIEESKLFVTYLIENKGTETMYFSVGAHPAFNVPLVSENEYNDSYLEFSSIENAGIYPIKDDGLISNTATPYLNNTNKLPLDKSLFYKDALIFKNLKSTSISILNNKNTHGLTLSFEGMPYMGIWSAKDANFVCIEPWCGLGDTESTNQQLIDKEGIIALEVGKDFKASWNVSLF